VTDRDRLASRHPAPTYDVGLVSPLRVPPETTRERRQRSPVLAESTTGSATGPLSDSASEPAGAGSLVAGRFRLEDLLEDNAGVRIWRATDLTLARNVTVHLIPADDPRAGAALTAARTSATVSDGRILRVLDALEEGDQVSIVHEWGSGLSLDRLVADEPLPARRAAWLVREVAGAIAVGHRHGVAHGRLLPENVMVNDAGSVKLAGFVVDGVLLGRSRPSAGEDGTRPAVPPLSEHESDVRNLGGLLYAALTGRWPGSPDSVLPPAPAAERGLVCRPRQVRSGVPRALDTLCDRLLNASEHRGRTLESATEVADALSAWLGEPVPGTAVTSPTALLDGDLHGWDAASPDLDPAPTGARAGNGSSADPEATQAWSPDEDTGETTRAVPRTRAPRNVTPPVPAPAREVPAHWGPDRPEDAAPPEAAPERGLPWLRLAAVLAALTLAVLAVVVAFDLGSTPLRAPGDDASGRSASPSPSPSHPIRAQVSSFDPDDRSGGPPEENPDLVPLATDGNPATAWTTETYTDGPPLAPYKRGVGLLLDLGREVEVGSVDVTLVGVHDLTLFAAPEGSSAPTDIEGLTRVARETGVQGRVRLPVATAEPVRTRWLVVWLTALPVSGSGYRGQVSEVVVRS
jgi:serine/threonine protein kinase